MRLTFILTALLALASASCSRATSDSRTATAKTLEHELTDSIATMPGAIGVAIITPDSDTIAINNDRCYPLMSVFKLHQALAVAHALDRSGRSLDSVLTINRADMDTDTWSPMLKDHTESPINLSVAQLLNYTLQQSDNNASNLMFESIASVEETDSFIRTATGLNNFKLTYTEGEMKSDHNRSLENCSSPLDCALLISKVFTDSLVSDSKQQMIQNALLGCITGQDRIAAPLIGHQGINVAHKTGSGYRNSRGELMAHNDVGMVFLPDGRHYAIAVLVTDFPGTEEEAARYIAKISEIAFRHLGKQ